VINLNGGKRRIRTIEFWRETKSDMLDKAEVAALGQH
jgi:hypothetical protein